MWHMPLSISKGRIAYYAIRPLLMLNSQCHCKTLLYVNSDFTHYSRILIKYEAK